VNAGPVVAMVVTLLAAGCGGAIRVPPQSPPASDPAGGTRQRVVAEERLEQAEVAGTIRQIDPSGWLMIDSPLGLLRVWVTDVDRRGWQPGEEVRVRMAVRAIDVVPVGAAPERRSAAPDPPPGMRQDPASYTVTIGRVVENEGGHMTVDSPRGDISVWAPGRYRAGDLVQVWTWVERRADGAR
jgi:hypothetical protein